MFTELKGRIYQPVIGFEDHLVKELSREDRDASINMLGPLYHQVDGGSPRNVFWTQNIWLDPIKIEFDSISEAASSLRSIQRNWAPSLFTQFRRGALIQEKLPFLSLKPKRFPWLLPESPVGSWTLLDAHTIIASPHCSSPFPGGVVTAGLA